MRVEHNVNRKIVTDAVEFMNLQYSSDGHTSTSKDANTDGSRSSRKRKSRNRRHKHSKTNKQQQSHQVFNGYQSPTDAIVKIIGVWASLNET